MSDMVERVLETLRMESVFLCALATVTSEGHPSVRTMRAVIADDLTLRAPTFRRTNKVKEIQAHPEVHVTCGSTDSDRPGSYFRITGRAQVSEEAEDRRAAWNERLAQWFTGPDDPEYVVIRISPTRIVAHPIGGGPDRQIWER